MKFLVDMPLSPGLATWLREEGHDALHALESGLDRASDAEILARARLEQRVILTADLDYPRLLALTGAVGPGLILFRGGNYSEEEAKLRLARALKAIPLQDLPSYVVVIEKGRIRRRRLPMEPPEAERGESR
ncbi:MAG: DUF5615 family PIN-like protein [Planctomycetes bacterium]|nr:DUF5615 family PIN-like protein [Planctomycetota bacterium]